MVAISATNSATPSLQSALGSSKLAQARREADQAEATAQNLRAQANAAEQDAQKGKERVRDLASRAPATDPTYGQAVQAGRSEKTNAFLVSLHHAPALKTDLNAAPVQNSQGQTTGRIVNLRA